MHVFVHLTNVLSFTDDVIKHNSLSYQKVQEKLLSSILSAGDHDTLTTL